MEDRINHIERIRAKWARLTPAERESVRIIFKMNNNMSAAVSWVYLSMIVLLILSPMCGIVLGRQREFSRYRETVCNATEAPVFYYCAIFKPFCVSVRAVELAANRTVVLRYPNHSPGVVSWMGVDVADWLERVKDGPFRCFLRGPAGAPGATSGVLDRDVVGLNGWRFAAALCGTLALIVVALVIWLIVRGGEIADEVDRFRRDHPALAGFLRYYLPSEGQVAVENHALGPAGEGRALESAV